ncbi:DUF4012 domain-containing protein [Microbacterium sp. RD1]|uniref:DUF4012 domain-containing protein n=1 Tax=Microbacterium sp. RD1 TaxID=3457313 RepID=UPI003FA5F0C6
MAGEARRRTVGRIVAVCFAAVLGLIVVCAAWVGIRAYLAQEHLQQARSIAAGLSPEAFAGEGAALDATVAELSAETSAARSLMSDPVWAGASALPWIGPQLRAVSAVATGLDEIVSSLEPLAEQLTAVGLDAFAPQNGVIDTNAFVQLQASAAQAAADSARAAESLDDLNGATLLPLVRAPFEQAVELTGQVADAMDALARATVLLPPMLGSEGPRDYLVLFQNNAEWRSLGGLVGSVALLHTEDGRFSLAGQGSGGGLGYYPDPPIPFDDEVLGIYGTRPGRYPANVTQLPDFTLGAPLAREFWKQKYGQEAAGAIAIDPVALSYLLEVVGPVQLPTGDTVTAENVVQLVLNDVYLRYDDPVAQNLFFDAATAAVFDAISTRPLQPAALLAALGRAAAENRLFIWSADPEEQAVLDGTTLQGRLPVTDADATRFGVYVNDGTGSKLDYYMRLNTGVAWCTAYPDGTGVAQLRVNLRNDAPADIAGYTPFITGGGNYGVEPGTTRTLTYVYLPEGAEPFSVTSTDGSGVGGGMHQNRMVYSWTTDLLPGESVSLDVIVRADKTKILDVVKTATIDESADLGDICHTDG